MKYALRKFIFNIIRISPIQRKPPSLRKNSPLEYSSVCSLEVNLPPSKQFSGSYPELIDRLCEDWGEGLSGLSCSSGDFRAALIRGNEISLGHIWAEIYCLCLDRVFVSFEGRNIHFSDQTKPSYRGMEENRIVYRVEFSFSEPYPLEFRGIDGIVNGYLNSIMTGREFDIQKRLTEFIEYRREPGNGSEAISL